MTTITLKSGKTITLTSSGQTSSKGKEKFQLVGLETDDGQTVWVPFAFVGPKPEAKSAAKVSKTDALAAALTMLAEGQAKQAALFQSFIESKQGKK